MKKNKNITTLFLDIGGVLLTNGWDRHSRNQAVEIFNLKGDEINERHHLTFDTYESGKIDLDNYLTRVIFYKKRKFSREQFKAFMFDQSKTLPEMLTFIKRLKKKHNLKLTAVTNEGKELAEHRIKTFKLYSLFDTFVASSFIKMRKPDLDIYKYSLDISQVSPENVLYIDDRKMFVEVASTLGIRGIHHKDFNITSKELSKLGLHI